MFILLFTLSFGIVSCSNDDDDDIIENPDDKDKDKDKDGDEDDGEDGEGDENGDGDEDGGDGEEEEQKYTWEDFVTAYSNQYDNFKISNVIASNGKTVDITVAGEGIVDIPFNNIVPESESFEVTGVELEEDENNKFSFVAVERFSGSEVTVIGNFSMTKNDEPQLNIEIDRYMESDIVEKWHIKESGLLSVYAKGLFNVDLSSLFTSVMGMFNPMITEAVEDVVLDFNQNGLLEISWTDLEGNNSNLYQALAGAIPGGFINEAAIRSLLSIEYITNVEDGTVTIAIDKKLMELFSNPLIGGMLGDFNIDEILELLDDMGGYYGLALGYTIAGSDIQFRVEKELVNQLIPLVS